MNETIDIPSTAVTVHKPEAALAVTDSTKSQVTAAQAKVEAVANLTMKAYERASTLQLTPEEVAAIQTEFPDEAFQTGAAGKENLIYIEHAHLRDRLNQVFGPGQWAIVPRNRWAEDFLTADRKEASRVYVEAMLLIRGCFVAEAVGDMVYYKNNASQNYGDAVEGAKTAALRRCAKELGIGLQAWKKEFCEGWWARKRGTEPRKPQNPYPRATTPLKTPPAPVSVAPKAIVAAQDERFEDAVDAPIEVPRDKPGSSAPDEWYMKVIVPIPHKGQKRADYLKNPDTIGSLYEAMKGGDQDAGRRLWGFANNYEPRGWEKSDGTVMPASESDHKFREALDAFVNEHDSEGD